MPSETSLIQNPKYPDWFKNPPLKNGDLITRKQDNSVFIIYEILSKIIYVHDPRLENPAHCQLTALTIDQIERDYQKTF